MKQRIITAVVATLLLALVLIFKDVLLRPAIIAVAFIGLWEFYHGFKDKCKVLHIPAFIFTALNFGILGFYEFQGSGYLTYLSIMMTVIMLFFITLLVLAVFLHEKHNIIDVAVTFFGYVYVVILFSFLYLIATAGDIYGTIGIASGTLFYLFILFAVSWGSDMGGYFTGIACGKHKLCEKLSPKKTIEGAIGGVLFSIIIGLSVVFVYNSIDGAMTGIDAFWQIAGAIDALIIALLLAALSVLAQIGDFVASSIKRYVAIKDYSNIMPGHGGILDRFDSLIFVTPILYMIMNII